MSARELRVALLGLGTMGSGMAGRLLMANIPTTLFNRNGEKALPFRERGAHVASSPREAAGNADVVIGMVSDDNASRTVWLGEDGALRGVNPGTTLVECSTLTVGWVKELSEEAARHGCDFLDAPVTGSKPQAAAGELLFLVGGSEEALKRVRPIFSAMGRGALHLGATGSGALLKLINNFLCGVQAASMAEALALIEAAGLDNQKAITVLGQGAPGSPILRRIAERAAQRDFNPAFSVSLMAKDLAYAIREGSRMGIELKTATTALSRFEQAAHAGLGEQDFAAVTLPVRKESL